MQTGLKTLTNKLDDAKNGSADAQKMFAQLGISLDDINTMSREDLFGATITGFQKMADTTERAALANDLFGKSGQNLTPLFNQSVEDTQALMEATEKYGMIMSDDAVKASADFNDALDTMQRGLSGLKNGMMADFLPGITEIMTGLTEIISGNSDTGLAAVNEGINAFVNQLAELAPRMFEIAGSIIMGFAQAIIDNLPVLLDAGLPIIMELVQAVIDNLPTLLQVGLQMLLTIAKSLGDNLPTLIPAVVDTVLAIVDGLIDNIDLLIDASIAIIVGLADGLINAMPRLIQRLPEIVQKIVTALIQNAPKLLEASVQLIASLARGLINSIPTLLRSIPQIITAIYNGFINGVSQMANVGANIVNGIWSGIKSVWQSLVDNVTSLGQSLVNSVKSFFQIGSPSKLFANEVGQWIPEGIAVGIEANEDDLFNTIDDMVKESVITPNIESLATSNVSMSSGSISNNDATSDSIASALLALANREMNVNVSLEGDAQGLFRQVRKQTNQFIKSTGASPFMSPA
jgi:phage-related protein